MNSLKVSIRGRKFPIKSHSRRTRGGRRVVVRSYRRRASKRKSRKDYRKSGIEFEDLLMKSPYGEPIEKRLHTFQGSREDGLYEIRRYSGDKITEGKRKSRRVGR